MKKVKLILFLLLIPTSVFCQENIIKGKVVDRSGSIIPGVAVILKGSKIGTYSDFEGEFTLDVRTVKNGVLEFSYLGYNSKTISFTEVTKYINVTLIESSEQLEEIVVTALGIKRDKKSLSYSTQTINTDDMKEARTSNFLDGLAGTASGVQIVGSSTPTGSTRVIIRGLTSITGNNQPLYILDGVPLDSSQGDGNVSVWDTGDDLDLGSPLSSINPDDIESIQVLKGANASALYGSRASNGVILITTKKAKKSKGKSKFNVNVNSNVAIISNREYPNYQYAYGSGDNGRLAINVVRLDNETGLPLVGSYFRAYGAPFLGQQVLTYNGTVATYKPDVNNIKDLYTVGVVNTNTFSVGKVTGKSNIRFSYSKTLGDHVIDNLEKVNRDNISLRLSHKINKKLGAIATFIYNRQKVNNRMYQNGSNRNPANNYMYMLPDMSRENLFPYKDENNSAFNYAGAFNNPYWNLFENSNQDVTNRIVANVTLNWKILKDLSLKTRINGAINNVDRQEFNNKGAAYDPDGLYREINTSSENWNYEAILNYTTKFNDFSLVSLLGVNRFDLRVNGERNTAISLIDRDIMSLSNGDEFAPVLPINNNKRINSVFGSASFGYLKTYFVDITARNDWSSTLPKQNNSYFYPSIGGTTIITKLLPRNNVLSFAKVRASYAQVGSDTAFDRIVNNYIEGGNYNNTQWFRLETLQKNSELRPELTTSTEFGLETKFFRNRVSFDATYYTSSTDDQIIPVQITPTSGFTSKIVNAGEIKNEGIELFLSARIFDKKFKWRTDINWSKNETTVVSLFDGVDRFLIRNWFNVGVFAEIGQPFGNIRGNAQAKDPETGTPLVQANGRVLWESDQLLGNAQADWIGSLRNSFSFKGFTLNFLIDVKKGGDLFSATMVKVVNQGAHAETIEGREEYLFSSLVLGENNNERQGRGLFGNDYADADRVKGRIYEGAALGVRDADGNWVAQRDANGNIIYSQRWLSPQLYGFDGGQDQARFVYDASFVKLREVSLGYTIPRRLLKGAGINNMKVSLVGRDLWTIYRNTPQGIDPEANTNSGNGQGIEYGSFLPTRSIGFNISLAF